MADRSEFPISAPVVAIVGGTVLPVTGPAIEGGTVLVKNGVIAAVGTDIEVPEGAEIVDATGSFVAPGFVESHGHIGIHEEANGRPGDDTNEMTNPNGAGLRALDAVNIDDEGFRDALDGGVTSAVIKPGSGNPIGGQTVAIKTWGGRTIDEQVISESVSVKSALGENPKRVYGDKGQTPSTRLGVAYIIRKAFTEARDYAEARAHAATEGKPFARDLAKETLARVLDGELAWDQHTHRHDDIATAMRLADEFGYRLVINHGTEGHKLASLIAEKDIPVIYGPMLTSRSKVELRDRGIRNLVDMAKAGVRLAITTDHPVVPINHLVLQAQLAVREGLDPKIALEALTINPATFMGIDKCVGSLEEGKDADVVIWSADPLSLDARPRHVFIGGSEVYRRHEDGTFRTSERF